MPIYNYQCQKCGETVEKIVKHTDPAPFCTHNEHGQMQKLLTTPAFKFKNGKGTDGGNLMSIPGHPLPSV